MDVQEVLDLAGFVVACDATLQQGNRSGSSPPKRDASNVLVEDGLAILEAQDN